MKKIKHWQIVAAELMVYDILAVNFSYLLALLLRFELKISEIPDIYWGPYKKFVPIYTLFCLVTFWLCRLYKSVWRYASYNELYRIVISSIITFVFHTLGITLILHRMPMTYYTMGAVVQFLLIVGSRFSYRFVILKFKDSSKAKKAARNKVLLVGAGSAGRMILTDINHGNADALDEVVCIIDDNPNKKGRFIDGVPIVGNRDDILDAVKKYSVDKIYIALPSASLEEKRDIIDICKESGCELKNLPGMHQLVSGEVDVSFMKDVSIDDLLGRDQIKVNMDEIFEFLKGKVIMVTGGGGSIGSELCRQIAKHEPKQLIIFEVYENNAYDIEQELRTDYPGLDLKVLIGSVRDSRRLMDIFSKYKPNVVYHAAAHKHVPLMENSPCEAIKNNAIGTYKTAYAAMMNGCERFVLISTDKAVNPTNIMGASKRLCEMIVQTFDRMIKEGRAKEIPALYEHNEDGDISDNYNISDSYVTEYVAVRFGNVLGSNGSVVPLFKKQIAHGGPVTVTHPDIIRYFMTIPEAVSLVLQAGTYASGGEIFVLDMGEPVKIDTLARNLIKLSGYTPDVDIKVEYTGLRPGEKLYEEKLMAEEGMKTTPNKQIHIGQPLDIDIDKFMEDLKVLMDKCYSNDEDIDKEVQKVVVTYHKNAKK